MRYIIYLFIYLLIKHINMFINNILGYFHHRQFFKVASSNPNECFLSISKICENKDAIGALKNG